MEIIFFFFLGAFILFALAGIILAIPFALIGIVIGTLSAFVRGGYRFANAIAHSRFPRTSVVLHRHN